MDRHQFKFSNPFSSIELQDEEVRDSFTEWLPEDFDNFYFVGQSKVAFATDSDDNYEVTLEESDHDAVPADCSFAVLAPLAIRGSRIFVRGGYTDVDFPVDKHYESVLYLEFYDSRVTLRLRSIPCAEAEVRVPRNRPAA